MKLRIESSEANSITKDLVIDGVIEFKGVEFGTFNSVVDEDGFVECADYYIGETRLDVIEHGELIGVLDEELYEAVS